MANLSYYWCLHECTIVLKGCLYSAKIEKKGLKKAVVEDDFDEVCALLGEDEGHRIHLNKLWSFTLKGCTLHVPPLCVAICRRNVDILQLLLKHGANPNRLGRMHQKPSEKDPLKSARFSPLMLALEDNPDCGLPFDPAVATALVEGGADINATAGGDFEEEEEEGGSIRYNHSTTLLFRTIDPENDPTWPPFKFLLDSGADMWLRNGEKNWTALQLCLDFHRCEILNSFAKELIRYGGFTSSSSVKQSEFITLLKIWAYAVEDERDDHDDVTFPQSTIHFLLDAGYRCSKVDIDHFKTSEIKNMDRCFADKVFGLHLYSLKQLCRMKIRRSVQHGCQLQKLKCLPQCLIDYLKFAEI